MIKKERQPTKLIHRNLDALVSVIEEFRKLSPSMTANSILAFITIAANPGITVKEVQNTLGLQSSSAVRSIAMLSATHRGGIEGLDLIQYREDNYDRRVKHLYLRPSGERIWNTIKKEMGIG